MFSGKVVRGIPLCKKKQKKMKYNVLFFFIFRQGRVGISLGLGRPSVCVRRRHARPTNIGPQRNTGYLLYWYKSTNTDVEGAALVADTRDLLIPGILISTFKCRSSHIGPQRRHQSVLEATAASAQFVCFPTKVQIRTQAPPPQPEKTQAELSLLALLVEKYR